MLPRVVGMVVRLTTPPWGQAVEQALRGALATLQAAALMVAEVELVAGAVQQVQQEAPGAPA